MGDDDDGPALDQFGQGVLDLRLGLRVREGRRLVEDQDRGVHQERPGDGHALRLPARQVRVGAHDGVQARGERLDEVGDARMGRAAHDLLVGGAGPAECDVVADRDVEQLGVLEHEGDVAVELLDGDVAQVHPAQGDAAGVGIGEAGDQGRQRGLSRTGGADQGRDRALAHRQAHVVECQQVPVGEGDVVEDDVVAVRHPVPRVLQGGDVEDLDEAQGSGSRQLIGPGGRGEDLDGLGDDQGDERARDYLDGRDASRADQKGAPAQVDQEQHRRGDHGGGQRRTRQQGLAPGDVETGERLGGPAEAPVGVADAAERFDDGDPGDELDHGGRDLGQVLVHLGGLGAHVLGHPPCDERVDG